MSLADDVVALLEQHGPMETEFIRNRLCVASEQRLHAAIGEARHLGRIEPFHGGRGCASAFRIAGDERELGAGNVQLGRKWRQQQRAA